VTLMYTLTTSAMRVRVPEQPSGTAKRKR